MAPNSVVITALKKMLVEPLHDIAGICFNLRRELLEMFDKGEWLTDANTIGEISGTSDREWSQICFDRMFKHWPKANLSTPMYPIEGGKMAYAQFEDHMWDEHHTYGKLRRELCQFCIEYLEKEDAKEDNKQADSKQDDTGGIAVD